MIFTGVTGGEIVSLLYPLFILNAFCYIIISKESLDGSSSVPDWAWGLPGAAPGNRLLPCRRCGGDRVSWLIRGDDRAVGIGGPGFPDVPLPDRGGHDGTAL